MSRPGARLLDRFGGSLRARLTLAFGAIILVTLLLAGLAFAFILQDYQVRRETNRVAELTQPLSNQVRALEQLGATTQEIVDYLERQADELDLRVVLADVRGTVFADTEDTLVGQRLQIQGPARFGLQRRVRQATARGPDGEIAFMVSPTISGALGERFLGRQSAYIVGLNVPRHSLAAAWLELLPRLSLAALAALLVSIGLAWPLAASIARPLASMTRAAEGIAQGRLEQQIPVTGRDEVGRLAQAFNKMAREVSASQRTLRDFLANVSHDLRTPLTSIQGFSQALTDGTLAERAEVSEAGRVINHEATRMSRLVDDLLYLSKIESGQAVPERREIDLVPLFAARVEAAALRAAEAGVDLRWLPSPSPPVLADPGQLERVLDNLLDNALNHTPAGGDVTVRLGAGASTDTSRHRSPRLPTPGSRPLRVRLSVHNTGSTIPPEDLPRVFERFYQVDRARAAGGSGLGLAISHEIVQAHGGQCWATSSPEAGTEFIVELPGLRSPGRVPEPHRTGIHGPAREVVIPLGSATSSEG